MMKRILFTSALLCASLVAGTVPGNRQYTLTFTQSLQVGTAKLAPGVYKLKVEGETATFTNSHKENFTAPVKVEKVEKKAAYTAIETKNQNGTEVLNIIDIGGAEFKLVF